MDENKIEEIKTGIDRNYSMSGLKLTFYGLLFTAINIRIQGFDIVPDVVGYIMVIVGLSRIEKYEEKFSSAKLVSYLLAILSLINIIQLPPAESAENTAEMMQSSAGSINFTAGIFGANAWLATLFMIVGMLANLYFAYSMCMGMKTLLLRVGDETLAKICDDRWKLIMAAEIGLLVSLLTTVAGVPFGAAITMIFGALALVALVLFLLLIHHAYKSIDGKEAI